MKVSRRLVLRLQILLVAACLLVVPSLLRADVIYLNDGNVLLVEKAWIEGDEVKYQTSRGVLSVPRSTVRDIQAENLPAAPVSSKRWSLSSVVVESGTDGTKTAVSATVGNATSNES